jgi:hypothetical protein
MTHHALETEHTFETLLRLHIWLYPLYHFIKHPDRSHRLTRFRPTPLFCPCVVECAKQHPAGIYARLDFHGHDVLAARVLERVCGDLRLE